MNLSPAFIERLVIFSAELVAVFELGSQESAGFYFRLHSAKTTLRNVVVVYQLLDERCIAYLALGSIDGGAVFHLSNQHVERARSRRRKKTSQISLVKEFICYSQYISDGNPTE